MENFRIEDVYFEEFKVSLIKTVRGYAAALDFDPDDFADCQTMMRYSPDQVRELAAVLIKAADEVESKSTNC